MRWVANFLRRKDCDLSLRDKAYDAQCSVAFTNSNDYQASPAHVGVSESPVLNGAMQNSGRA